jgi:hypothetical protein
LLEAIDRNLRFHRCTSRPSTALGRSSCASDSVRLAFAAGAGVILGYDVTPWSVAKVAAIALLAVLACAKLLRELRAERIA